MQPGLKDSGFSYQIREREKERKRELLLVSPMNYV